MLRRRLPLLLACLAAALLLCSAVSADFDQPAALVEDRATAPESLVTEAQNDEQRLEHIERMLSRLERKGKRTTTRFLDLGEEQVPAAGTAPATAPSAPDPGTAAVDPGTAAPAVVAPAPAIGGRRSVRGIMGRLDSIESAIKELQRSQMSAGQIAQAITGTQSEQIRRTATVESKSIMDFARDRADRIRQAVVSGDVLERQNIIDSEIAKFPVQLQVATTRKRGERRQTALKDLTVVPEMMRP